MLKSFAQHLQISGSSLPIIGAMAVGLSAIAPDAIAFTLNSTSGSWSNPVAGEFIQYQTVDQETQVRWGYPAYWVPTGGKSGLGFLGVGETEITSGDIFNLGRLRHYNKTLWYGAPYTVDLSLALDFAELGVKSFNYTLDIEETPNYGTCAYYSVTDCADRIVWNNALAAERFELNGSQYTLELAGFSSGLGGNLMDEFISQEGGSSDAYLYAKLTVIAPPPSVKNPVVIRPPATRPPVKSTPEPGSLLAIAAALGSGYLTKRRQA
ncbi:choice-of-anchor K domain-containing protein [Spirulina major]|uniref:choice-of-anchor K domain-containing protein n=1 Tax=Spirulina major TaxID=270636 RepID=UPI0009320D50|nr:choice-of-anchor K domain-containing protein [Spirulina major]